MNKVIHLSQHLVKIQHHTTSLLFFKKVVDCYFVLGGTESRMLTKYLSTYNMACVGSYLTGSELILNKK